MLGDENFMLCKFCEKGGMKGYYTRKEKNIEIVEKKILLLAIKETVVCQSSYYLFWG